MGISDFGLAAMITVRLANLGNGADQQAILALVDMYSRDAFGADKPLDAEVHGRLIAGLVRHGGARVLLAVDEGKPLGIAVCFLGFSTFQARPVLNVHDIAVVPEARGQGVGSALLAAAEALARDEGCCKLTLEVRADNARAQTAYRRAGYESTQPETWFWSRPLVG